MLPKKKDKMLDAPRPSQGLQEAQNYMRNTPRRSPEVWENHIHLLKNILCWNIMYFDRPVLHAGTKKKQNSPNAPSEKAPNHATRLEKTPQPRFEGTGSFPGKCNIAKKWPSLLDVALGDWRKLHSSAPPHHLNDKPPLRSAPFSA